MFFLLLFALFLLPWVLFVILFVRIAGLDNRIKTLEKTSKPLSAAPATAAPCQAPQTPQTDTEKPAPTPAVSAAAQPQPQEPVCGAQTHYRPLNPFAQPERAAHASANQNAEPPHTQNVPVQDTPAAAKISAEWKRFFNSINLFSWIGGFTLFLGFAFWIKYSIDNNLITPQMRLLLSFILGLLMLAGGLWIKNPRLKTTANTLCGVGLTVLYATVFGAHAFYQIIGAGSAFVLMAAISFFSFAVAVWKKTKYVGFLAEIISFITPFLLANAEGNLVFLFAYVAFINIAAAATALKCGWDSLLIGSLCFTFLTQLVYFSQNALLQHTEVFCLFSALYALAAAFAARKYTTRLGELARNLLGFFISAQLLFVAAALCQKGLNAAQAMQCLALGLWLNILLVYLTCRDRKLHTLSWQTGKVFVFISLLGWTQHFGLQQQTLLSLLGFLAFAAVNGGADLYLYKRQACQPGSFAVFFPVLLMLPLMFHLGSLSFAHFFLGVLLLSVLMFLSFLFALAAGKPKAALWAGAVFILALLWAGPSGTWPQSAWRWVLGFGLIPMAGLFAAGRYAMPSSFAATYAPVFASALMPYILVITALGSAQENFILCWTFTLLLNLLCLFFAYIYKNGKILPAALAGTVLVQLSSFALGLCGADRAFIGYTLAAAAIFTAFPLVFKQRFLDDISAWETASLSGAAAFGCTVIALKGCFHYQAGWPALGFAAVYLAVSYAVSRWQSLSQGIQRSRMAWLGGVSLLFITAFFPLQFSGNWLTLAWALEGTALVWLKRKLDHPGLSRVGYALLVFVFLKVLFGTHYVWPEGVPVCLLNTFLYTFGISALALLAAAALWQPRQEKAYINSLKAGGGALLFMLLNVEIAVFFTQHAGPLSFDISGSFNSAIAYTVGWTAFGSVCLFLGLGRKNSYTSAVGMGLIGVALLKLFLSDIWALGGLYRIGGLFGVAILLIGVSFVFQLLRKK